MTYPSFIIHQFYKYHWNSGLSFKGKFYYKYIRACQGAQVENEPYTLNTVRLGQLYNIVNQNISWTIIFRIPPRRDGVSSE